MTNLNQGETALDQFEPPYDMILACEVIYEAELVEPLLHTLRGLSEPDKTVILLAYDCRGRVGEGSSAMLTR